MMHPQHRILLVDDDPGNLRALERTLHGKYEITSVGTATEGLIAVQKTEFAVVISDQRMPDTKGTDFLAKFAKICPRTSRIILTGHADSSEMLDAINRAEIYRFITKPWVNEELLAAVNQGTERYALLKYNEELIRELAAKSEELTGLNKNLESLVAQRTAELQAANEKLSELAMTDPLTRILNRRAFSQKFVEEIERSSRYKHPILVAMVDVDHFKEFNDMEGHVYGDEALRKIAQNFLRNLRKSDTLARYGGEEFIIMMPETSLVAGKDICQRLRQSIEAESFQGKKEAAFLTVSVGIAAFPQDGKNTEELIRAADASLYAAKEAGRNRVMHHPVAKNEESFFVM